MSFTIGNIEIMWKYEKYRNNGTSEASFVFQS